MLRKLVVDNYRLFRNKEIEFGDLTLLTGFNATGKSTILEILYLLRLRVLSIKHLVKNPISKGSSTDIVNISLIYNNNKELNFEFKGNELKLLSSSSFDRKELSNYNLFDKRDFAYINPSDKPIDLKYFREVEVYNTQLLYPGTNSLNLVDQLNYWMSSLISGFDIYEQDSLSRGTLYLRAILIDLLMLKPGSLILLENPEAYLHPSTQSKLAKLIAQVVRSGVQIVVETNSENILDGIRVEIKRQAIEFKSLLDTKINFFRKSPTNDLEILSPKIDEDGRIDKWPQGFFDQTEKDLLLLL